MFAALLAAGPKILSAIQFMITLGQLFPTAIKTWKEIEAANGDRLKAKDRRDFVARAKSGQLAITSKDGGKTWAGFASDSPVLVQISKDGGDSWENFDPSMLVTGEPKKL